MFSMLNIRTSRTPIKGSPVPGCLTPGPSTALTLATTLLRRWCVGRFAVIISALRHTCLSVALWVHGVRYVRRSFWLLLLLLKVTAAQQKKRQCSCSFTGVRVSLRIGAFDAGCVTISSSRSLRGFSRQGNFEGVILWAQRIRGGGCAPRALRLPEPDAVSYVARSR
jgi:hypothetical protein